MNLEFYEWLRTKVASYQWNRLRIAGGRLKIYFQKLGIYAGDVGSIQDPQKIEALIDKIDAMAAAEREQKKKWVPRAWLPSGQRKAWREWDDARTLLQYALEYRKEIAGEKRQVKSEPNEKEEKEQRRALSIQDEIQEMTGSEAELYRQYKNLPDLYRLREGDIIAYGQAKERGRFCVLKGSGYREKESFDRPHSVRSKRMNFELSHVVEHGCFQENVDFYNRSFAANCILGKLGNLDGLWEAMPKEALSEEKPPKESEMDRPTVSKIVVTPAETKGKQSDDASKEIPEEKSTDTPKAIEGKVSDSGSVGKIEPKMDVTKAAISEEKSAGRTFVSVSYRMVVGKIIAFGWSQPDGRFLVQKWSYFNEEEGECTQAIRVLREDLHWRGVVKNGCFVENECFQNAAIAAATILGDSTVGADVWQPIQKNPNPRMAMAVKASAIEEQKKPSESGKTPAGLAKKNESQPIGKSAAGEIEGKIYSHVPAKPDWIRYDFTNWEAFTRTDPAYCRAKGYSFKRAKWGQVLAALVERELEKKNPVLETLDRENPFFPHSKRPFFLQKKEPSLSCLKLSNGYWVLIHYSTPNLVKLIGEFALYCGFHKESVCIYGMPKEKADAKTISQNINVVGEHPDSYGGPSAKKSEIKEVQANLKQKSHQEKEDRTVHKTDLEKTPILQKDTVSVAAPRFVLEWNGLKAYGEFREDRKFRVLAGSDFKDTDYLSCPQKLKAVRTKMRLKNYVRRGKFVTKVLFSSPVQAAECIVGKTFFENVWRPWEGGFWPETGVAPVESKSQVQIGASAIAKDVMPIDGKLEVSHRMETSSQPSMPAVKETETNPAEVFSAEECLSLLRKYFPNGLILTSVLNMKSMINYANTEYGTKYDKQLEVDRNQVKQLVQKEAFLYANRAYDMNSLLKKETKNHILSYIETLFANGAEAVYYTALYSHFQSELAGQTITNADMLEAYLKKLLKDQYYFKPNYFTKQKFVRVFAGDEVKALFRKEGRPLTKGEVYAALPYLPISEIDRAILVNGEFICNQKGVDSEFFLASYMDLSQEEIDRLADRLTSVLAVDDYIGGTTGLLKLANETIPDFRGRYPGLTDMGLRNGLKYYLEGRFIFNGNIVSDKNHPLDAETVWGAYADRHESFSVDDLKELKNELEISIYYGEIYKHAVRVKADRFAAPKTLDFSEEKRAKIDSAIAVFCKGDAIPIKAVDVFSAFPYVGYPWNSFLLESYVMGYSRRFGRMGNDPNGTGVAGAIVKKDAPFTDFDDVLVDALAKSDCVLKESEALDFLAEAGYLQRRTYGTIATVLLKANGERMKYKERDGQ